MRRIPLMLISALLVVGLIPTAAMALTEVEEEVLQEFEMALNDLDCLTAEGCIEEVAEFRVALAAFRAAFPDLDYTDIDACLADFDIAVDDASLEDMQTAALCIQAAGAILAEAADAEPPVDPPAATTTIAEVVTDLPDGGSGPSVGLLGAAALLVLLASGAFVLRLNADRR
jgi:hypothetical protein